MRKNALFTALLLALLGASAPVNAQGFTDRIFVHVFNLNIGGLTSKTNLVVYRPATGSNNSFFGIECLGQDGSVAGRFDDTLAPGETRTLPVPVSSNGTSGEENFIGSCVVTGGVASTANWEIQVASNPGVAGSVVSTSVVGQRPYDREEVAADWALPVGEISPGSLLGLAIYNRLTETTCTVRAVDGSGAAVAGLDQVEITIPTLGQIATFPFNSQDLVGKFISLRVTCGSGVLPIAVVQDAANGFPTPSYGFPHP